MISGALSAHKSDAGEGRTRGLKAVSAHPRTRAATGLRKRRQVKVTEDRIQAAVFEHLRTRGKPGLVAFHPKNGGLHQRTEFQRIRNKRLGIEPGIPDVIVLYDGLVYALELKTLDGKPTEEQKNMLGKLHDAGVVCGIVYGLDNAIGWLEMFGLLRGRVI